jgi:hypothetical protein
MLKPLRRKYQDGSEITKPKVPQPYLDIGLNLNKINPLNKPQQLNKILQNPIINTNQQQIGHKSAQQLIKEKQDRQYFETNREVERKLREEPDKYSDKGEVGKRDPRTGQVYGSGAIDDRSDVLLDLMPAGRLVKGIGNVLLEKSNNLYKYNPFANKQPVSNYVYRAQNVGQDIDNAPHIRFKKRMDSGEKLAWWQEMMADPSLMYLDRDKMIARNNSYGRWFHENPIAMIDYSTRNTELDKPIELLRKHLSNEDIKKSRISNFPKEKVIRLDPNELLLSKEQINTSEKYPITEMNRLIEEHYRYNKPHFLFGYRAKPYKSLQQNPLSPQGPKKLNGGLIKKTK